MVSSLSAWFIFSWVENSNLLHVPGHTWSSCVEATPSHAITAIAQILSALIRYACDRLCTLNTSYCNTRNREGAMTSLLHQQCVSMSSCRAALLRKIVCTLPHQSCMPFLFMLILAQLRLTTSKLKCLKDKSPLGKQCCHARH